MPYIKPSLRLTYNEAIKQLPSINGRDELKYVMGEICAWYHAHHKADYQHMNDVIGVLVCTHREFKRRIADPMNAREEERNFRALEAKDSEKFDQFTDAIASIESAGELNYVISEVCAQYLLKSAPEWWRCWAKDVMAVLRQLVKDFYDERVAPYEDEKIKENGDTGGYAELTPRLIVVQQLHKMKLK